MNINWKYFSILELVLVVLIISSNFFIPTLFILPIALIGMRLRKESFSVLGFKRDHRWKRMAVIVLVLSVFYTLFTLAVTLPILMHLTGQKQDLSSFLTLKGDISQLITFLIVIWSIAAIGEEIVYRGYLLHRIQSIFTNNQHSFIIAILVSSAFFGLAHTEQGLIGVIVTFIDAIYFNVLKKYYNDNLWASVFAHGFNNTIGVVGFYFLGPIYSFW